ncbi:MAG TPA: hypothetical protein VNL70_09370, partial [Tepidisphaeraceae bacterium]|nr:hypothetical protein [Tepidisphaeraceae bacterium]
AVAENLQLERALPSSTQPAELDVAIDTLGGITIQEMDWAAMMKDQPAPELDPLASLIPADQHAIFFASFPDMRRFLDEAQKQGSIFVVSADALRSESFETLKRYQRQLCLPLEELSGVLSPPLVQSIAITGSDAYLRVGSDVAVLFQTADAQAMFAITTARRSAPLDAGLARQVAGEIDGVSYQGAVAPDRSICSYSAALDNSFVVTNSLSQLRRIIRTHQGQSPALAGLPEYRFFRHRYARGQDSETAFLILSDATIRRWCGPTWRILDSRRTLAAALMSELVCQHIDALVSGGAIDEKLLEPEFSLPNLGQVMLSSSGIRCNYGSLQFMTPIVELAEGLTHVSTFEAEAYKRWRNTYQQNWSRYFDPIACRFSIVDAADGATSLAADLTVMPLIVGTEYRQFIAITAGASLKPGSGDPHPQAIGHLALAIDPDAGTVRSYNNLLENLAGDLRLEPLSWLGSCVALYADDDPFWTELAAAEDPEEFLEHNLSRLPIALYAESRDPLRLAAFLTAFRGFVEQTAPNLTRWETLRHADVSYVKVQAEAVVNGNPIALYYVALPAALIVSPSEPVIRRAIERNAGPATRPATQSAYTWLGGNVGVRIDPRLLEVLDRISGDDAVRQLQRRAWSNLPILNEWKRRFPDRDPIEVHRRLFAATLIDPAGGSYSWNDRWQTMQSLNYGHPGEPEAGPCIADLLRHYSGEFGLTFEHNGLRARAKVRQHNPG